MNIATIIKIFQRFQRQNNDVQVGEVISGEGLATFEKTNVQQVNGDFVYESKYGPLKLVKNTLLSDKQKRDVKTIYYVVNGVGSNYVRKVLKNDRNALIVFDSSMGYVNAFELFNASRKMLDNLYYGNNKNPFVGCKSNLETFNLSRRVLIEQKKLMSKLNIVIAYDGVVRLQGRIPECSTLKYYLEQNYHQMAGYQRYSYLLPFQSFQGILTAYNYEKEGIKIKELDDQKVYSLYSVWNPTQPQYLSMVKSHFQKISLQHQILSNKNHKILDIGCGTGVLGFIAKHILSKECQLYSIDNNPNAINASKINAQHLKINNFQAIEADLNNEGQWKSAFREHRLPTHYDIIIANPPWITASALSNVNLIENAVYDPKGKLLNSIFDFASKYLTEDVESNKRGRLILIYSDISYHLGLQDSEQVQKLCTTYQLTITAKMEEQFSNQVFQFLFQQLYIKELNIYPISIYLPTTHLPYNQLQY